MVVVKKFNYKTSNKNRIKIIKNKYTGEHDRPTMITNLIHIKRRNRFAIKIIEELFDQGKNILCLTGRIKQVDLLYCLLNKNKYIHGNVGKYIGKMSEDEQNTSATKQIIIGTYNMAEEGLDIPNLNALVLCTPKSTIKQSVGRILRKEIYEEHPIIIDIVDDDNIVFKNQSSVRESYYKRQKYNIQKFNVTDYSSKGCINWNDTDAIHNALVLETLNSNKAYKNEEIDFYDKIEFLDD